MPGTTDCGIHRVVWIICFLLVPHKPFYDRFVFGMSSRLSDGQIHFWTTVRLDRWGSGQWRLLRWPQQPLSR